MNNTKRNFPSNFKTIHSIKSSKLHFVVVVVLKVHIKLYGERLPKTEIKTNRCATLRQSRKSI